MNIVDRYIQEMREKPFTMVMLCFVTIMTTSNAAKTPSQEVQMTHQRLLREISLTQASYGSELQLSYRQCMIETTEAHIQQLKFLKPMLPEHGQRIDDKIEELSTDVNRSRRKVQDIQQSRSRELEKVNRFFNDHQIQNGGSLWEDIM